MKLASLVIAATLATTAVSAGGCYGKYAAFHKIHAWNGKVTSSRIGNSAIHALLYIVPVYPLIFFADVIIFNTIETITGSNPLE
jgi:hypothetical protein